MERISVIGAGSYGSALAASLHKAGRSVKLWAFAREECESIIRDRENRTYLPGIPLPEDILVTNSLEQALLESDLVIMAVPSHAVAETALLMRPYVGDGIIVANVAKGFCGITRLSEQITQSIPGAKIVALSGPSHAEEVGRGVPTTNVAASADSDAARCVQNAIMTDVFRVYINDDIIGVELGGALKNVIALCAGISDGIGYGDNSKAALITRGVAEMTRLAVKMGAQAETLSGLSGMGDLIVTCTSVHSRNRRAGMLIGQGMRLEQALAEVKMTVEGVYAARAAMRLATIHQVEMPIVEQANAVLFENKPPKKAVAELMNREKKTEF